MGRTILRQTKRVTGRIELANIAMAQLDHGMTSSWCPTFDAETRTIVFQDLLRNREPVNDY